MMPANDFLKNGETIRGTELQLVIQRRVRLKSSFSDGFKQ
jgi:hypothetical protein